MKKPLKKTLQKMALLNTRLIKKLTFVFWLDFYEINRKVMKKAMFNLKQRVF